MKHLRLGPQEARCSGIRMRNVWMEVVDRLYTEQSFAASMSRQQAAQRRMARRRWAGRTRTNHLGRPRRTSCGDMWRFDLIETCTLKQPDRHSSKIVSWSKENEMVKVQRSMWTILELGGSAAIASAFSANRHRRLFHSQTAVGLLVIHAYAYCTVEHCTI